LISFCSLRLGASFVAFAFHFAVKTNLSILG
jgi:hypothetical protein